MEKENIAPCGINCELCSGFQRRKKRCSGCNSLKEKPAYCTTCKIKHCAEKATTTEFCISCRKYPCSRLKNLDKRYRTKYGVDIYDNMKTIQEKGMAGFLQSEEEKWKCGKCGEILCMHKPVCISCGERNQYYVGSGKVA